MKTVKGDLLKLAKAGSFDIIVHGCKCFCTMGAGIAKEIAMNFPEAYQVDRKTVKGDRAKLGTCSVAKVQTASSNFTVINAYTQYDYRGSGDKIDYGAVRSCMRWISDNYGYARIGLPKIGAGLGGGDWSKILAIIKEELGNRDVTVVEYENLIGHRIGD
jgi:O-acetyl-ADP-ribose deacetylase (regulator of RNase III)